jgi:hypothetical protein
MWAQTLKKLSRTRYLPVLVLSVLCCVGMSSVAHAITPITPPGPQSSSYGLEATKKQPPPTEPATITTPNSGGSYTTSPITVSGLCKTDLLVQVYDNGALVGSVLCKNGSFSLQVTLFTGDNELSATVFDDLGQAGPDSNKVTVSYNNADFSAFGTLITLTSNYGRRAAPPGSTLTWPLLLSGGSGPYAFSIDWGDGSAADLKSQASAGEVNISHVYKQAGIYRVTIKVTDVNGVTAFLQVVAVANGQPPVNSSNAGGTTNTTTKIITKVLWIPAVVCLILLPLAYWLGRRSELVSLHRKLEKDIANYKEL